MRYHELAVAVLADLLRIYSYIIYVAIILLHPRIKMVAVLSGQY